MNETRKTSIGITLGLALIAASLIIGGKIAMDMGEYVNAATGTNKPSFSVLFLALGLQFLGILVIALVFYGIGKRQGHTETEASYRPIRFPGEAVAHASDWPTADSQETRRS